MSTTYSSLNHLEWLSYFKPNLAVELVLHYRKDGEILSYATPASVMFASPQTIEFALPPEVRPFIDLFTPESLITIHHGRSEQLLVCKSRIAETFQENELRVVVVPPRVIANKERRQLKRVPFVAPVSFQIVSFRSKNLKQLANKVGSGEIQDVSLGGLTLLTDLKLPIGLIIQIELTYQSQPLILSGIVRRVQSLTRREFTHAVGIQFIALEPEDQYWISTIISFSQRSFHNEVSV